MTEKPELFSLLCDLVTEAIDQFEGAAFLADCVATVCSADSATAELVGAMPDSDLLAKRLTSQARRDAFLECATFLRYASERVERESDYAG